MLKKLRQLAMLSADRPRIIAILPPILRLRRICPRRIAIAVAIATAIATLAPVMRPRRVAIAFLFLMRLPSPR